ncbi:MAG: guanylate kinase [Bacilli bacterium]|nr:guanylate kinase [Bacilli bacterium]
MIVLAGPSASGKTEVAKYLASHFNLTKIITTTTRPMRKGEVDGRDYFFVTIEKFNEMVENDEFVEYTVYNGNMYGSTKDQIDNNKCVVIDPIGLKAYVALNDPNIVTFYLKASEKIRYKRMIERGDSIENAKQRILNDKVAFNKKHMCDVDFKINSENTTIEEVSNEIYQKYLEKINR